MKRSEIDRTRVLLVSHGFQKNYECAFANGLHAVGVNVLLVSSDQTHYASLAPGVRTLNLRGSQSESRPNWQKFLNLLRYHAALMLWVAWHRPAVVHAFGLLDPVWLVGHLQGWWFRRFAGRYVLTVHDTEPHDRGNEKSRQAFVAAFGYASHLVVHSKRLAVLLAARLPGRGSDITFMEHGLDPWAGSADLLPYRHGRPVKILLFGVLQRYKGLDILLDALDGIAMSFELVVAGRCSDHALRAELSARIAAHPQAAAIRWHDGYVPEQDVPALFIEADMLVLPYRRIDQSGVLFQAYRFGLPVVATKVGAFEDYVGPEHGEVCDPEDAVALRAAIERLSARLTSIDRRQLAESAQDLAWPQVVRVLLPVYGLVPSASHFSGSVR
jgi:glycosyltransferase involved in cell wall biosynthesis